MFVLVIGRRGLVRTWIRISYSAGWSGGGPARPHAPTSQHGGERMSVVSGDSAGLVHGPVHGAQLLRYGRVARGGRTRHIHATHTCGARSSRQTHPLGRPDAASAAEMPLGVALARRARHTRNMARCHLGRCNRPQRVKTGGGHLRSSNTAALHRRRAPASATAQGRRPR